MVIDPDSNHSPFQIEMSLLRMIYHNIKEYATCFCSHNIFISGKGSKILPSNDHFNTRFLIFIQIHSKEKEEKGIENRTISFVMSEIKSTSAPLNVQRKDNQPDPGKVSCGTTSLALPEIAARDFIVAIKWWYMYYFISLKR